MRCLAALLIAALATTIAARPQRAEAAPAPVAGGSQQLRHQQVDIRDLSPMPRPVQNRYQSESEEPAPPRPTAGQTGARKAKPSAATVSVAAEPQTSWGERFVNSIDLSITTAWNGPALGSSTWGTTYNPFARNTAPFYFYHTVDADYRFDHRNTIGVQLSAKQDLVAGITPSGWTAPVDPQFSIYDPQFWYRHNRLLDTSYFSTDVQLSFWPSMTDYSRSEMMMYFSGALDTTWNIRNGQRRLTTLVTTRIKPTYYLEPQFNDGYTREWLFLQIGGFVGYTLSTSWQLTASATFDNNLFATYNQFANHGDANDDRAQIGVNYFAGSWARIGAFLMAVPTNPTLESTAFGMDLTINLLTSRL